MTPIDIDDQFTAQFRQWHGDDPTLAVLSPYRVNPLGAHVDHQGGAVLGRTINLYTTLVLKPIRTPEVKLRCFSPLWDPQEAIVSWRNAASAQGGFVMLTRPLWRYTAGFVALFSMVLLVWFMARYLAQG